MACSSEMVSMGFQLVASNSTTVAYAPAGVWKSTMGLSTGRAWGEGRVRNGNVQATPGIFLSNSTTSLTGGTFIALGATIASETITDPLATAVSLASAAGYKFWRPAWQVSLTAGSTLATMAVSGVVEVVTA